MIRMTTKGLPFRADVRKIIDGVMESAKELTKEATVLVEDATFTWNNPVKFRIRSTGSGWEVSTNHPYFNFVDGGTSHRYMKLSEDWKSKSSVRSLVMGPGAGRALGLTSHDYGPIQARVFFFAAYDQLVPHFGDMIARNLRKRGIL